MPQNQPSSRIESRHSCTLCKTIFSERTELLQHQMQEHRSAIMFCPQPACKFEGTLNIDEMRMHERVAHPELHGPLAVPESIETVNVTVSSHEPTVDQATATESTSDQAQKTSLPNTMKVLSGMGYSGSVEAQLIAINDCANPQTPILPNTSNKPTTDSPVRAQRLARMTTRDDEREEMNNFF